MRKLILITLVLVPLVFVSCKGDRLRGLPPGAFVVTR
jgi:hypothetical protein